MPGSPGTAPAPPPPPAQTRTTREVLTINPSLPFQRDSSRRLSAKLLGDLESYNQVPNLNGKWLMVPTKKPPKDQSKYITLGGLLGRADVAKHT